MQVAQWGDTLAVRLPAQIVEELDLKPGDEIEVRVTSNRLIEIGRESRTEEALEALRELRQSFPEGFKFDREEANERT